MRHPLYRGSLFLLLAQDGQSPIILLLFFFYQKIRREYTSFRPQNVNRYPEMSSRLREKLNDFFYPHTAKLYKLLGKDFGWDSFNSVDK